MPRATVCMKERAAGRTGMLGLAGLRHSCSEAQFAWFRAGSALNCLDASSRA